MAWWVLLHGLSSLARYHSALWRRALDFDSSPDAVVLEEALAIAMDDVPQLVLSALYSPDSDDARSTADEVGEHDR